MKDKLQQEQIKKIVEVFKLQRNNIQTVDVAFVSDEAMWCNIVITYDGLYCSPKVSQFYAIKNILGCDLSVVNIEKETSNPINKIRITLRLE